MPIEKGPIFRPCKLSIPILFEKTTIDGEINEFTKLEINATNAAPDAYETTPAFIDAKLVFILPCRFYRFQMQSSYPITKKQGISHAT